MMAAPNPELTDDYRKRLDETRPKNLPPELDLFDEETSRKGLRLNRAAYSLKHEEQRTLFAEDEQRWMDQFGLTDDEQALMRGRDWIEMWRRGMSIYTMTKLIGVTGTPLVEIGKRMRESGTGA
jgi:hypothetical protein